MSSTSSRKDVLRWMRRTTIDSPGEESPSSWVPQQPAPPAEVGAEGSRPRRPTLFRRSVSEKDMRRSSLDRVDRRASTSPLARSPCVDGVTEEPSITHYDLVSFFTPQGGRPEGRRLVRRDRDFFQSSGKIYMHRWSSEFNKLAQRDWFHVVLGLPTKMSFFLFFFVYTFAVFLFAGHWAVRFQPTIATISPKKSRPLFPATGHIRCTRAILPHPTHPTNFRTHPSPTAQSTPARRIRFHPTRNTPSRHSPPRPALAPPRPSLLQPSTFWRIRPTVRLEGIGASR